MYPVVQHNLLNPTTHSHPASSLTGSLLGDRTYSKAYKYYSKMILNSVLQLLAATASFAKDHWPLLVVAVVVYELARRAKRYASSPFKKQGVPGPFLAGYTCWYRAYYANIKRNWHAKLVQLHEQYGPIVWIAPDEVSVADPKLRNVLYGFADERKEKSFFPKSKAFETGLFNNDFNFVFETDPAKARLGKYALAHPYSEKGLSKLEHNFDEAVLDFKQGFAQIAASNDKTHCFSDWTHFFMFDLATLLMSGSSNGLCRAGRDVDGAVGALRVIFNVVGSLVPIPFALTVSTKYIRKCVLNGKLEQFFRWSIGYSHGEERKKARINEVADRLPSNLMAKFRAGEKKMRKLFPHGNWTEAITNNVFFIYAGSMVASNALPLVVKHIYSDFRVLAKVREELAGHPRDVKIDDMVHHDGKCALPYLEATILEALRLSPTFGLSLGRTVPSAGCQLNEYFVPPGYVVSMSGWSNNINTDYFGPDAKEFKPERWLGNHPTDIARDGSGLPRTMKNYLEAGWFTFGAGSRVCVGRHLSMIAFTKFISTMVREFDLDIVQEPYLWYGLIQHTEKMLVKARVRSESDSNKVEVVIAAN